MLLHIPVALLTCITTINDGGFMEWFASLKERARDIRELAPMHIKWAARSLTSAEEVQQLIERVRGHPDHPDLVRLEQATGAHGGTWNTKEVWINGPSWRRSDTFGPSKGDYYDYVVDGNNAWGMSAGELVIYDPRKGFPSKQRIDTDFAVFGPEALMFVTGGFSQATRTLAFIETPEVRNGVWVAEGKIVDGEREFTSHFEGTWNESTSEGVVRSAVITMKHRNQTLRDSYIFTEWHQEPFWQESVAHRVIASISNGALTAEYKLVSVEPLDTAQFDDLCTTPADNGVDPVRGSVTFTSVLDHRKEALAVRITTPSGDVQEVEVPDGGAPESGGMLKTAGWISAGLIGGGLVAIRAKKAFSRRR
jgi:hypothetical protein